MTDVAAYLAVSHQRVVQMRQEGKLPKPDRVPDRPAVGTDDSIERWAERKGGTRDTGGSDSRK